MRESINEWTEPHQMSKFNVSGNIPRWCGDVKTKYTSALNLCIHFPLLGSSILCLIFYLGWLRKKLYTAIAPFIRDDYTSCCGQVMLDDINQIGQHISLSQFHIWWGERSTLVFITSIKRLCNSGWALLFEDLHLVRGNFSFGRQICHMPFRWEGLDGNKQKSLWKSN